jgi:hypothetical protein
MRSWSDTAGDHHMLAANAIEKLRTLLRQPAPAALMQPLDAESALSDIRDIVDETVSDEHEANFCWDFIGEICVFLTPAQLQLAFAKAHDTAKSNDILRCQNDDLDD